MLDKPWIPDVTPCQQPHYQILRDCTYWLVLRSFNNCNIITFFPQATASKAFDEINRVVVDNISDNMALLVQFGNYGSMKYNIPQQWAIM